MRLVTALAIGTVLGTVTGAGGEGSFVIMRSPSDLQWTKDPDIPGGFRARVMGEGTRPREHDVMMLRWQPSTRVPPHRHKGEMCHGVVLEGMIVAATACGESKELPAGSFFFFGGEAIHSLRCMEGGAGCRLYWSQPSIREPVALDCPSGNK